MTTAQMINARFLALEIRERLAGSWGHDQDDTIPEDQDEEGVK